MVRLNGLTLSLFSTLPFGQRCCDGGSSKPVVTIFELLRVAWYVYYYVERTASVSLTIT